MAPTHRKLHFATVDEAVAEVERLAACQVQTMGNFSFPQIINHLATAFDISSAHQMPPKMPLALRLLGPLVARWIIKRPMEPGVKLPSQAQAFFWKDDQDLEPALNNFREAFARYCDMESLPRHPLFGNLSRAENEQLQCRHMELHLGFVHAVSG